MAHMIPLLVEITIIMLQDPYSMTSGPKERMGFFLQRSGVLRLEV